MLRRLSIAIAATALSATAAQANTGPVDDEFVLQGLSSNGSAFEPSTANDRLDPQLSIRDASQTLSPSPVGISIAPFAATAFDDDEDDSVFTGVSIEASVEIGPSVFGSVEQSVFYEFNRGEDGLGGRTAAGIGYEMPMGSVTPYVGVNAGAIYTGGEFGTELFVGPEIGLKYGPVAVKVAYDVPFKRGMDEGVLSVAVAGRIKF